MSNSAEIDGFSPDSSEIDSITPVPQSPNNPSIRNRLAMKTGAGILALNMLAGGIGAPKPVSAEEDTSTSAIASYTLDQSRDILKDYIEVRPDGDIEFEDAVEIIPATASLFHETFNSTLTPEEIVRRTFIASSDFGQDSKPIDASSLILALDTSKYVETPFYQDLLSNYGDSLNSAEISNSAIFSVTQRLLELQLIEQFQGQIMDDGKNEVERLLGVTVSNDNVVFIFRNATNNFDGFALDSIPDTDCESATPDVNLVSTLIHEYVHLEALANSKPEDVSPVLLDASNLITKNGNKAESGTKIAFSVQFKTSGEDGKTRTESFVGLDEFVTHYLASKGLLENGLETIAIGIKSPQAMANFESILNQAGISTQELFELHSQSQLNEFLVKVAKKAKGMEFTSDSEALKYGFEISSGLFQDKPDWATKFKDIYEVDLSNAEDDSKTGSNIPDGCVIDADQLALKQAAE